MKTTISVDVSNRQKLLPLRVARLREAVRVVLAEAAAPLPEGPVQEAKVSVAVVDDGTISRLNAQFLQHEGPTDVLSFLLERRAGYLEGEVVVSAETALRVAPRYGAAPPDELLLYVVHGALHLLGYDDATAAQRRVMRRRERECLAKIGRGS